MKQAEAKQMDEMKMPADDFNRIMRKALGMSAPVENKNLRQTKKAGQPAKK